MTDSNVIQGPWKKCILKTIQNRKNLILENKKSMVLSNKLKLIKGE